MPGPFVSPGGRRTSIESTCRPEWVCHGRPLPVSLPLLFRGLRAQSARGRIPGTSLHFADRPARHPETQPETSSRNQHLKNPFSSRNHWVYKSDARSCCGVRRPETSRPPDPSTLDHAATPFVPSSKLSSRNTRRYGRQHLSLHTLSVPAHGNWSGTLEASLPGERNRSWMTPPSSYHLLSTTWIPGM